MTALQIASEHCANWRRDEKGCLGAVIDDDLQIRRCTPRPKCLLGTPGVRCLYFEECVAAMARSIRNDLVRREFEKVVWRYRVFAKLAPQLRPCPGCGWLIEPRMRFCVACATKRRRETSRLCNRRARQKSVQLGKTGTLQGNHLEK